MFVFGKPLQSSLMFVGNATGLPLSGAPENIRLGWRGLSGTNTLACYENPEITAVKSFIVQAPGPNVVMLFTIFQNKLECLPLAILSSRF